MPNVHSLETQDTISSRRAWKRNDAIINITDLRLRTYIGFNPEELSKQQDVIINCELQYEANEPCSSDDETTALNYKTITKKIIGHVEQGRFRLLEKLTEDLLQILMESDMATRATVKVDKPHALRFADSVSVTLSASRQ
jgi:D-erythro-7,8-dihydroneopterin triphosphate epimerase